MDHDRPRFASIAESSCASSSSECSVPSSVILPDVMSIVTSDDFIETPYIDGVDEAHARRGAASANIMCVAAAEPRRESDLGESSACKR